MDLLAVTNLYVVLQEFTSALTSFRNALTRFYMISRAFDTRFTMILQVLTRFLPVTCFSNIWEILIDDKLYGQGQSK